MQSLCNQYICKLCIICVQTVCKHGNTDKNTSPCTSKVAFLRHLESQHNKNIFKIWLMYTNSVYCKVGHKISFCTSVHTKPDYCKHLHKTKTKTKQLASCLASYWKAVGKLLTSCCNADGKLYVIRLKINIWKRKGKFSFINTDKQTNTL